MTLLGVVAVAAGSGIGALTRWALTRWNHSWPVGTLVANLTGCLGLGLLLAVEPGEVVRTGLGVGLFGGLTTFSTFAVEAVEGPSALRWGYLAASVVGGAALLLGGLAIGASLG